VTNIGRAYDIKPAALVVCPRTTTSIFYTFLS
jgi:hypothetical protein